MPAYDAERFFPPAPVALVTLRNPATNLIAPNIPMLVDTGADATLVPQHVVESLGIDISDAPQFEIIGIEKTSTFAKAVSLDLILLGRRFRGAFLLTPNEYGILGRNVLNRVSLLLVTVMRPATRILFSLRRIKRQS